MMIRLPLALVVQTGALVRQRKAQPAGDDLLSTERVLFGGHHQGRGRFMNEDSDNVTLATELTVAWLGNPNTRAGESDVPAFLSSMHRALSELGQSKSPAEEVPGHVAAVSVRKSLASGEHIISLIDGKPYRTLKRHLASHGLTPDEYRQRYGLKADYPMVARTYSEARRSLAVARGLGRKAGTKVKQAAEEAVVAVEHVVEDAAVKLGKGRGRQARKPGAAGRAASRDTADPKS